MDLSNLTLRLPYRDDRVFGILTLVVLVVPLTFSTYIYENFETIKYALWLVLFGWAALAFANRQRLEFRQKRFLDVKIYPALFCLLGFFVFLGAVSVTFGLDWIYGIFGTYFRFAGSWLFFLLWSGTIVLILQAVNRDKFLFLLKVLVFDALLVAAMGLVQSLGFVIYSGTFASGFTQAPSLLGNQNFSAMFLAATLPLSLYFGYQAEKFSQKIYYYVTSVLMFLAILAMASRGAVAAFVVAVAVAAGLVSLFFLKSGQRWKIWLAAISLALVAGLAIQITRPSALPSITTLSDNNISLRLLVWQITLKGLAVHPWLGTGLSNFHIFFERARGENLAGQVGVFDDAHNLYLQLAETGGLPFLAVFLSLVGLAIIQGLKNLKSSKDGLGLALLSGIFAWLAAACFTPVSLPCYLLLALLICGLVLPSLTARTFKFSVLKIVLVSIFGGIFLICGLGLLVGEHLFATAYRDYFAGNYQRAYFLSDLSIKFNPTNQMYYLYRAGSQIKLNQPWTAIQKNIQAAINLHPDQARTYVVAANLYHLEYNQAHNPDYLRQTIGTYQRALDLDPNFAERYSQLAMYEFELGRMDQALSNAQRTLALRDDYFPAWMLLAKIYQMQNDRTQAIRALNRAYLLNPNIEQLKILLLIAKQQPDIKKVPIDILVRDGPLE